LRRLGFDPGPEGPITREKAEEALDFLKKRRVERPTPDCGDWDLPSGDPGSGQDYEGGGGPGGPGGGGGSGSGGPGGGPPPVTPPGVPPQDPASPVLP
jgi:aminocarboxymuconate-semialdehyde decarboxylase